MYFLQKKNQKNDPFPTIVPFVALRENVVGDDWWYSTQSSLTQNEVFVNPQLWLVVRYHSQEHSTFRKKDDEERSVKAICAVVRFLFPVIMYGRYGTVVW